MGAGAVGGVNRIAVVDDMENRFRRQTDASLVVPAENVELVQVAEVLRDHRRSGKCGPIG